MKKSFLLFSTSLLVAGSIGGGKVFAANANAPTVGEQIQTLIGEYIGDGRYTKKTTIGLNDASVADLSACFHANQTAKKRTTYYKPDQLLLAAEDGTIPAGSGSYVYDSVDHEVKRSSALDGTTEENMWDNLSEPVSVGHTEANGLEKYYITLSTFMSATYFDGWGHNGDVYYYDLSNDDKTKNNETGIYNCDIWNEFLYFCAPMLYQNSGYYFSAKSLTITEKYDNNAEKYLCLDMYLEDWEKEGKLSENYLAEARIYKGNRVFAENLDKAFYLVSGENKIKFNVDPDNNTHLMIRNETMTKGTAVKVWDTFGNYYGKSRGMDHVFSVEANANTGFVDDADNYIIPENGQYDFYVDFNDDGSYRQLYIYDLECMFLYIDSGQWADINGDRMWCRYYDKDRVEITTDQYKPYAESYGFNADGHCIDLIVVPGEAKYLQICYHKADWSDGGAYVETDLQEIKYPEYNTFVFDQWNSGGHTITFEYSNIKD
jgi:hypothetical protein